jgi:hypothetical protein
MKLISRLLALDQRKMRADAIAFRLWRLCSHLWMLSWRALPATCLLYDSDRLRGVTKPVFGLSSPKSRLAATSERLFGTATLNIADLNILDKNEY